MCLNSPTVVARSYQILYEVVIIYHDATKSTQWIRLFQTDSNDSDIDDLRILQEAFVKGSPKKMKQNKTGNIQPKQ